MIKGLEKTGKNLAGHINELLKIEFSGDRQYRILQSGRTVKQISTREIPAKAHLLNGQWVDVFKSSPGYDFQGASPYALTDVGTAALMITTTEKSYVLYGAGVDASSEEVVAAYRYLAGIYNEIQARRDSAEAQRAKRPLIPLPQVNIQLPKVKIPELELPPIKNQPSFIFNKKGSPEAKALPQPDSDQKTKE